jgi:outer membrane protein assembly factor BamA
VSQARLPAWACALLALLLSACAHVPADRYGVKSLAIEGTEKLDADALKTCLTTHARPRVGLELGARTPTSCGEPPFTGKRWHVRLWTWGFSDWPLYDRLAFERDKERILRWYEARGFHAARVVRTVVDPAQAGQHDVLDEKLGKPGCERLGKGQGCALSLRVYVEEGPPTLITRFVIQGLSGLPRDLRKELWSETQLHTGERFDEANYEAEKQRIDGVLRERGYALAKVQGQVAIDRPAKSASIELQVTPGPVCKFGKVHVEGAPDFLEASVRAITLIDYGDPFSLTTLQSAQHAVFSGGGFMSVSVEPILPATGNVVDVRVVVTPARKHRPGLGLGVQAGIVTRGDTWEPISIPQWDVHMLAKYTQERFLNGARQLRLEERPAMIIQEPFPGFTTPRFGNELRAQLRQASVIEARTSLQASAAWIWGPDSFDTFFRHRIDTGIGLERRFLRDERLFLSFGLKNSVYRVPEGELTSAGEPAPASSVLTYLYQRTRFDYRDNEARPHKGFMLQTEIQGAGIASLSSWRYVRSTPDARVYIPLPYEITFALRFALGMYFIFEADKKLDQLSQALGPRDYRLRGGGATSNRGFLPGELGDGPDGGTRRWESSAELRVPVSGNLGMVGFFDAGDVSKKETFRWKYPQASAGFGLRYQTLVGPVRLDVAWRIKNMQVFGPDERDPGGEQNTIDFGFAKLHGAIHFTIGESF